MSKFIFVIVLFLIIAGALSYVGYQINYAVYGIPKDSPTGDYSFEVKKDQTVSDVASYLKSEKVITNTQGFQWQAGNGKLDNLQTGDYTLKLPATQEEIIKSIESQSQEILRQNLEAGKRATVRITFKEGLQMDQYLQMLEEKKVVTIAEMTAFAQNPDNFKELGYQFLPTSLGCTYGDLKTCAKYYPEGYLYPDTYDFFENSTPKEVYVKFLNNFRNKVWNKLKPTLTADEFHRIIILASVLEKETGRTKGVTAENAPELAKERKIMADVFYNREAQKIPWQSDVTAEYGHGRKQCQTTFTVPNCIYLDDPLAKNLYNTYFVAGFPIGPITSPQYDNIEAAMNPEPNDYIYFVSDAIGRKYFAKTSFEHNQNIAKVSQINRELGI